MVENNNDEGQVVFNKWYVLNYIHRRELIGQYFEKKNYSVEIWLVEVDI